MFGDVAVTLLKMAGHSGTVPSALLAANVATALALLRQKLAVAGPGEESGRSVRPDAEDESATPRAGIRLRAYPLLQLLSAAAQQGSDVMWEQGQPAVKSPSVYAIIPIWRLRFRSFGVSANFAWYATNHRRLDLALPPRRPDAPPVPDSVKPPAGPYCSLATLSAIASRYFSNSDRWT